jgi:putative nucleotidyltransferase with HDIG domain
MVAMMTWFQLFVYVLIAAGSFYLGRLWERQRASINKQRQLDTWLRDSYIMQSRIVDKRDGQTFGHSQRVGELSETVALILRLSEDACNTIRVGGILHDLGNIAIPDSILLKPGKLTVQEYEIIKEHPKAGAEILAAHPEQRDVAIIVHHHHEKWDGTGYPDRVAGEQIPIGSRIVNACDAFDAITQARVFRPTVRTPAEAIRELRELAGSWYDPAVITALEKIVSERWGVVA